MVSPGGKLRILFLCIGNSCRSQMAEGWTRHLKNALIEPYSAGIEPTDMDPYAVRVMREAGVDISSHRPRLVDDLANIAFDYVVSVCDHAYERYSSFPARTRLVHAGFDDPLRLARTAATEEEALDHYRRVRDAIRAFVGTLPEALSAET